MAYRMIPRIMYIRNPKLYNKYFYANQESNSVLRENTALNENDKGLIIETDEIPSMNRAEEDSSFNRKNSTVCKSSSRGTFFNSVLIGEIVLVIVIIICLQRVWHTE